MENYLAILSLRLKLFCTKNDLPFVSADELIADDALNGSPDLVEWLDDYIWRWINAETIGTKQFAIEGEPISTIELVTANKHDVEALDWMACAEVGEYFAGFTIVQRIS